MFTARAITSAPTGHEAAALRSPGPARLPANPDGLIATGPATWRAARKQLSAFADRAVLSAYADIVKLSAYADIAVSRELRILCV
jgi:hypothetical protein